MTMPEKAKVLKSVRPNAGIEARYRRELHKLVEEMSASVQYWTEAAYRQNLPEAVMAMDARPTPASIIRRTMTALRKRWQKRFDEASEELAAHFAQSVEDRSTTDLKNILKRGGWAVKFKMTPAQRDIIDATVAENVSLIKSIPQKYLNDVEGMVMRAVSRGGDLGPLAKGLETQLGVTKKRAQFIARDQNAKATANLNRARQKEIGVKKAIWMHSHAGKRPRKSHVAMNGREYDIEKGMWDKDAKQYVLPGELINCRCTSRSVIPSLRS